MSQQTSINDGIAWISAAIKRIMDAPAPYLLMGLVVGVIGAIPILGWVALFFIAPMLTAGIAYAANKHVGGRTPEFQDLFHPMKEGRWELLLMCLPSLAFAMASILIGFVILGGSAIGAAMSGSAEGAGVGLAISSLFAIVLIFAAALATNAFLLFAIPRTLFDHKEPISSMMESFRTCMSHLPACLAFGVIAVALAFALTFVFGIILNAFVGLIVGTIMFPLVGIATEEAWRQIFDGQVIAHEASNDESNTPSDASPSTPPPAPAAATPPPVAPQSDASDDTSGTDTEESTDSTEGTP